MQVTNRDLPDILSDITNNHYLFNNIGNLLRLYKSTCSTYYHNTYNPLYIVDRDRQIKVLVYD